MTNDPMITPNGQLPPMTTINTDPQLPQATQEPKKPNKFLSVLGGVAGGALNLVAPGIGSIVGRAIGGSGGGSYGSLIDQERQFNEMQRYSQAANAMQQNHQNEMMNQQQRQSMQMLGMQNRVSMQSQEFATVSNLMKTRHDSEMTAVNNIKS